MKPTSGLRCLLNALHLLEVVFLEHRNCLSGVAASHSWRSQYKRRFRDALAFWSTALDLRRLRAWRSMSLSERIQEMERGDAV